MKRPVAKAGKRFRRDPAATPRRALAAAATLLVVGLALVATGATDEGSVVTLAGLVAAIFGIHTFGRLGPDEAPQT